MDYITNLFDHYGYWLLLISLILELIAFPLPGETLMTYCGYAIYTNKMNWPVSIIIATTGAITGITISYFIGNILGINFFHKYGYYVHLDKKRIDKISIWFQSYGSKLLIMAYFIPGVRHVTGYFSGITKIPYKKFAINSYIGAFIWTFTFITLGKVLGSNWEKYHTFIRKYLIIISLIIAIIVVIIYACRNYKQKILELTITTLKSNMKIFYSLGKIKFLLAGIAAIFLMFSILTIGIIQDYLSNEFELFDEIVRYLVANIFNKDWGDSLMKISKNMSSNNAFIIVIIFTVFRIAVKGVYKLHEIKFFIISCLGAKFLSIA